MSGIAGIVYFDGAPASSDAIARMLNAMAFRGPDGARQWSEGPASLGHCLLRATPQSAFESQPHISEIDRYVIVADARLDDRSSLAASLHLASRADAVPDPVLILKAFQRWGEDAPQHLTGDFAFFIWDRIARRGFGARDRTGAKPFHYSADDRRFVFASDVLPILGLLREPKLDDAVLAEFISGSMSLMDRTVWSGVKRLPAGCSFTTGPQGCVVSRYWRPEFTRSMTYKSDADYEEHYRSLLDQIVCDHSRAHGPIGCEASGGLDSSALFALAHRHSDVRGFTLDFQGKGDADELAYVDALSGHVGAQITRVAPTRLSLDAHARHASKAAAFPNLPNGMMGSGIRQAAHASGCRALLAGVGGDEWLHGDRSYYREAVASLSPGRLLRTLSEDAAQVGAMTSIKWAIRHGMYALIPEGLRRRLRNHVWRDADDIEGERWLSERVRSQQVRMRHVRNPVSGQGETWRALASAHSAHMMDAEERLAAEAGVELRRPYFDARLIEFSLSIPMSQHRRGLVSKSLHRRAMTGILPDAIVHRTDKAHFSGLFTELKPQLLRYLAAPLPSRSAGMVNEPHVQKRLKAWGSTLAPSADDWRVWGLFGCIELAKQESRAEFAVRAQTRSHKSLVHEHASGG